MLDNRILFQTKNMFKLEQNQNDSLGELFHSLRTLFINNWWRIT